MRNPGTGRLAIKRLFDAIQHTDFLDVFRDAFLHDADIRDAILRIVSDNREAARRIFANKRAIARPDAADNMLHFACNLLPVILRRDADFRDAILHGANIRDAILRIPAQNRAVFVDQLLKRERAVQRHLSSKVARLDNPAHLVIPEIALKLVPFIVSRKRRDDVMGDLAEDFYKYAAWWGRPYALRWLWLELAELCIRRFDPTAIVMGIAAWCRQKFGW